MKSKFIFYIIFFNSILIQSQIEKDSSVFALNPFLNKFFSNSFDKQLNTHSFVSLFNYSLINKDFFIGLNENFRSTIIKTSDKNIKDEQLLRIIGQYNLADELKVGLNINNNIYSDNRQIAINKASILNTMLFIKYLPLNKISLTPFGGFTSNTQVNQKDNGFIYGSEANIENYEIGEFELSSMLKYQNEDISPRKNTFRQLNFDLNNTFEESFMNTISAFFSNQRKDFYFIADPITAQEFDITNNIQSRLETNYLLQNRLFFKPINSPFSADLQARAIWRDIERNTRYVSLRNLSNSAFDTRIEELRLELSSTVNYKSENTNMSFRFSFSEREEKHQPRKISGMSSIVLNDLEKNEALKNSISQLANLAFSGSFQLSSKNNLIVSFFHRKLKYDTPSNDNYDDRDELLLISRVRFERQFNPYFLAFADVEGSLNKIVYIFAERSSNNNIQRILKLSSGGTFTLGKLKSFNSAEVSANYTVFDYEELNPNFKSYSFRQILLRDSTNFQLTKKINLFFTGYVKHSEQGDFKWSNFTANPSRYLEEYYFEPKLFYNLYNFICGAGLRYFSLETFNIANGKTKSKATEYKSLGPVIELNYPYSEQLSVRLYGWYEFISSDNNQKRETANLNFKLFYRL